MSKRHKYTLDIATESGLTADESQRILRAVLKTMLRGFGVRCLRAVEMTPDDIDETNSITTTTSEADE
jgi:hypothetical protein